MPSNQYRKSHCGDKTIVRSSYIHNGISYTAKTTSLYWIKAQRSRAQIGLWLADSSSHIQSMILGIISVLSWDRFVVGLLHVKGQWAGLQFCDVSCCSLGKILCQNLDIQPSLSVLFWVQIPAAYAVLLKALFMNHGICCSGELT